MNRLLILIVVQLCLPAGLCPAMERSESDLEALRKIPHHTTPRTLPSLDELRTEFVEPPLDHRTGCYWYWSGDYLTKDGITKDLEAMQRAGLATAVICFHKADVPKVVHKKVKSVNYGSDEWHAMVQHAIREAERLDITLGIFAGPGYRGTGGPWVSSEKSMLEMRVEAMQVEGPGRIDRPWSGKWLNKHRGKHGGKPVLPIEILLVAVPSDAKHKRKGRRIVERGRPMDLAEQHVLTGKLSDDGTFTWDAPAGSWTVLRFYSMRKVSTMGVTPFPRDRGIHVDKFSPRLLAWNMEQYLGRILDEAGPLVGETLALIHHDSQESGPQDWASDHLERFEKRFGYDPRPWLPALAGVVVEDPEQSRRFRWDFRRLQSDLAREYAAVIANWAHSNGLQLSTQRIMLGGNGVETYSCADIPSTESWLRKIWKFEPGDGKRVLQTAIMDYQGLPRVSCESFTHIRHKFDVAPVHLKAEGDAILASGPNHIWLHVYGLQPMDAHPGSAPYGVAFDRLQPWWDFARPWMDHMNRIQTVLQQTAGTAEVLTVAGQLGSWHGLHVQPMEEFINSDLCPADALADLRVDNGLIVSPVGKGYEALYLTEGGDYLLEDLQNLKRLRDAGARIHGDVDKPSHPPGRQGYPGSDAAYAALVDELWSGDGIHRGFPNQDLAPVSDHGPLLWSYRRIDAAEFFFIANPHRKAWVGTPQFAVTGKQPELWRPAEGSIEEAACWSAGERTTGVSLHLKPEESLFVVFVDGPQDGRHMTAIDGPEAGALRVTEEGLELSSTKGGSWTLTDQAGTTTTVTLEAPPSPLPLEGPWQVTTKPSRGESKEFTLEALQDVAKQAPPGRLLYQLGFDLPATYLAEDLHCILDLGTVGHAARVTLNGQDLGTYCYAPFEVPVGSALQAGANTLVIEVAPNWDKPSKEGMKNDLGKPGASWGLVGPVSVTASRVMQVP